MKKYTQLTMNEREIIAFMRQSKSSITQIAACLDRSKSTISRELRRNQSPPGQYWPDTANIKAKARRKRVCMIDKILPLKEHIITKLCCHYWTPEQISGDLKANQRELPYVSHETIYQWIYAAPQKAELLWKFLPRHKRKRSTRKTISIGADRIIPNRISIHDRPKVVASKKQFGHWEGDLMSCKKGSEHMLVLRERKTMFILSAQLQSKHAKSACDKIIELLKTLPGKARRTLTLDNGGEFAKHMNVLETLGMQSFFCDPYCSHQKGGVENTNGRLRRDLPRRTNLMSMAQEDFDEIIANYNETPRKKLQWKTPLQIFTKNVNHVALQT
jgi:IS30 family transposase